MVWLDLFFQHGSEQTQSMLPLPQFFKVTDDGRIALKWYSKVTEANPMNKRDTFLDSNLVLRKWILSNHVWWILMVCHEKVYEICFSYATKLVILKRQLSFSELAKTISNPVTRRLSLAAKIHPTLHISYKALPRVPVPKTNHHPLSFQPNLIFPSTLRFPIPFWQFNIAIEITISNR